MNVFLLYLAIFIFSAIIFNLVMTICGIPASLLTFWLPQRIRREFGQFMVGLISLPVALYACQWLFSKISKGSDFDGMPLFIALVPIFLFAEYDLRRAFRVSRGAARPAYLNLLQESEELKQITLTTVICTTLGSVIGALFWIIYLRVNYPLE